MNIPGIFERQKTFFETGQTKSLAFRVESLKKLYDAVQRYEAALSAALYADLHKSAFEAYSSEIGIALHETRHALRNVHKWARPHRVKSPLTHFGSKGMIYPEPYGCTLIIGPWNYPVNLLLAPLVAAIAAGNCAVIKPSELAPNTSTVLRKLVEETFPEKYIAVVEGGVEASTELLQQPFDHIFFTGGTQIGRVVMEAAAKNLTPVTLELGGKSPCIVHEDANLRLAAKRIVWGKFMNAGQTCVAPDYLLVQQTVKQPLLTLIQREIEQRFGLNALIHPEYPHVVNHRHFQRLLGHLEHGTVISGGRSDADQLAIEPTLIEDVQWHDAVMQEEIFGPILPVITYERLEEAITAVQRQPKPLALYLFSESRAVEERVLQSVSFGGGCINDTLMHLANPGLPFGGVGPSGMGAYHGKHGFDTFSHRKGVVKQTTRFDLPFRYPGSKKALQRIKWFLK